MRNILIGNGINIEFGGAENYTSSAIMGRVVENINKEKYNILTENNLSKEDVLEFLEVLVKFIDLMAQGKGGNYADGLFMLMEMQTIKDNYTTHNTITSVMLEDYFLAAEVFNNKFEDNEFRRKILKDFLKQMIVDGIYNDGHINHLYTKYSSGVKSFLNGFDHIFTINYDSNLEGCLGKEKEVYHLHGAFDKLAPEYIRGSKVYLDNPIECEEKISKKIENMEHIYCNAIMSWYWLDKYGELIDKDKSYSCDAFRSIEGRLEILGMSPRNDEHLFLMINQNPKIKQVVYYYLKPEEQTELPKHIKGKPIIFQSVEKMWKRIK